MFTVYPMDPISHIWQGCTDGGVCTHDAAEFTFCAIDEEAGEECLRPAQSRDDKRTEKGEETGDGGYE